MAKPSSHLDWAVGNPDPATNVIEPSPAKKISAWAADERPPYEFFNWLFFRQDEWNKYFETVTDIGFLLFDAIVGSETGSTHATLQDANDDAGVAINSRILVRASGSQALTTAINLTKTGWDVLLEPGVEYSKDSATEAIILTAARQVIRGGRFTGFTGGGDNAIELTAPAEYCKVLESWFGVGTNNEVDDAAVPAGKKPVISLTHTEV